MKQEYKEYLSWRKERQCKDKALSYTQFIILNSCSKKFDLSTLNHDTIL